MPSEQDHETPGPAPSRLSAVLVIVVLVFSILVGGGVIWSRWQGPSDPADKVGLFVSAPPRVAEGEPFDLPVLIRNRTGGPITVEGIDVSRSFLDGFVLIRAEPGYTGEAQGPYFHTFDYALPLASGEEVQVVFRLQAISAGQYAGEVDLRLTGPVAQRTAAVQATVVPPQTPTTPGGSGPGGAGGDDPLIIQPPEE